MERAPYCVDHPFMWKTNRLKELKTIFSAIGPQTKVFYRYLHLWTTVGNPIVRLLKWVIAFSYISSINIAGQGFSQSTAETKVRVFVKLSFTYWKSKDKLD